MQFLAIDLGDKRTGLAFGDDETELVSPLRVIERPLKAPDQLLREIRKAIEEIGPDQLVLGLPLNMDDSEGGRATLVREFAGKLKDEFNLPVQLQDERLTSVDADWAMAQSGLTHQQKKQRRDALAAAAILRDYLARLRFERGTAASHFDRKTDMPDSSW